MRRTALFLLAIGGFVVLGENGAHAGPQPAALTVAYGNGVHAYFDGDYQCSYDELSGVIEAGSNDPRAHYFRGLAALKLGRLDEAEADFQQGANLEAEGRGGQSSRAISLALERVQGCDRLKLERYRGQARVAMLQRDRELTRRRYSDIEEAEADVLRRRRPERMEPAEPLAAPVPKGDQAAEAEEPAAEETEKPRVEREEPAEPAEKPTDTANPFADEPA
ncbi:MAG: tetratricopeptide repeat protein [Planctomycetia bacterium]